VGAWTLYGFHEDGFTSGIRTAERLGAKIPFEIVDARYIRGKKIRKMNSGSKGWDIARTILVFIQWMITALIGFIGKQKGKLD
jgi:hypothetical protein